MTTQPAKGQPMKRSITPLTSAIYIATIILANVLTNQFGLVPIGFGLTCTAGTFAAGAALLMRNVTQDAIGRGPVVALMLIGCGLSWWFASPGLAVASALAFSLSETADMAVYTPLRDHGWARAALTASTVGALVDTVVFLKVAGFPVWQALPGQLIVKIGVCALAVATVRGAHALLREPLYAGRA